MKKIIASIYGAFAALSITLIYDMIFIGFLKWPPTASILISVSIGMILVTFYELLTSSTLFSRIFSPVSKVAGSWEIIIKKGKERTRSLCIIEVTNNNHTYRGYGIHDDGTLGSEWSSREVHYDTDENELSFTSDATLIKSSKRIRNYGYI